MRPITKIKTLFAQSNVTVGSEADSKMVSDALSVFDESMRTETAVVQPSVRRIIMKSRMTKLAAAALIIIAAVLSITFLQNAAVPAYALDQTVAALKNVRFMHLVAHNDAGQIEDERWIEVGMDGFQIRYRQENAVPWNFCVIEDGESTAVYRNDKKAVIIYDRKDQQFQWVGELGKAFENLRQEGKILEENADYQGRRAHKVWWPMLSSECYVDPETKLPISIGRTLLTYEEPSPDTFEIVIPEGYALLDKRPGAPAAPTPQWLLDEENAQQNKAECFNQGTDALARGDYAEAAEQLEQALGYDSWAPFWLGSAYYGLGQYDLAVENYTKLYKEFGGDKNPVPFCNYARGLAYAKSGNLEAATADFQVCLPAMIRTLRIPSGGLMFEYADNPMIRYGKDKPSDKETVIKMINRLRLITGENFGYDPAAAEDKEQAIAAWEQWFESSGQIKFSPDAEILPVPETAEDADK
jgi:tetratricopeptide (TPR) repeat protein